MAKIVVKQTFKAEHGTEAIRKSRFETAVEVDGQLIRDFVGGVDYVEVKNALSKLTTSLDGRYLDDIIGRATTENLASFIMFNLANLRPLKITVDEGDSISASVFYDEANWNNYQPILDFKLGASRMVRGKYEEAVSDFDKVLIAHPNIAQVLNCRGRARKYLKHFTLALEDHTSAIELNPNFGEAYRNRGNDHYYLGNNLLMMQDFDMAVQLMPNSSLALNNRGFALQVLKEFDRAIIDHTKAIELNPEYFEAYLDRAAAHKAIGDLQRAEIDERQAEAYRNKANKFREEWAKVTWPSLRGDGLKFLV